MKVSVFVNEELALAAICYHAYLHEHNGFLTHTITTKLAFKKIVSQYVIEFGMSSADDHPYEVKQELRDWAQSVVTRFYS